MTQELKFKAGDLWETRDGRKAFISYKSNDFWYGSIAGLETLAIWHISGRSITTDSHDLIRPWVDEPKEPSVIKIRMESIFNTHTQVTEEDYLVDDKGNWKAIPASDKPKEPSLEDMIERWENGVCDLSEVFNKIASEITALKLRVEKV